LPSKLGDGLPLSILLVKNLIPDLIDREVNQEIGRHYTQLFRVKGVSDEKHYNNSNGSDEIDEDILRLTRSLPVYTDERVRVYGH
jgi:hypothetical protein